MNCQLYRTNILLGGQMKYDLVVDGGTITDVHITPISDRAPYRDRYTDTNILNYENQSNIKDFYNKTRGYFYNTFADPLLESEYALPKDEHPKDEYPKYDKSTWMGCSRMEYKLYNKQFQFFAPIWLEDFEKNLKFHITIKAIVDKKPTITIVDRDIEFDEKTKNYFTNYFNYIKLDDRLIKIDLDKNECVLHGINASTGLIETKKEFTLTPTLKHRERPLLEFDSMIVNSLVNNTLIAKQLMNFNICFNIDDFISPEQARVIFLPDEYEFTASMKVIVDEEELELKDFYTNYEYIPRATLPFLDGDALMRGIVEYKKNSDEKYNVLDYLKDYKCVDLVNKNKVDQKIFHWSLCDNSSYIFNLYNGFGGVLYTGATIQHRHGTSFAPSEEYVYGENSTCWCPYLSIDIHTLSRYKLDTLKKACVKCESIMFDTKFGKIIDDKKTYHCMTISYNNDIDLVTVKALFGDDVKFIGYGSLRYIITYENNDVYIFIIGKNSSDLTYNEVLKDLKSYSSVLPNISGSLTGTWRPNISIPIKKTPIIDVIDKWDSSNVKPIFNNINSEDGETLKKFYNYLKSIIIPKSVVIERSICGKRAQSPNLNSNEIKYYKVDSNFLQYLFRYDGKIKPTFVGVDDNYKNYLYTKKIIKDNDVYLEYTDSKFQPRFPSIEFYSFEEPSEIDYNNIHDDKWFNNGILKNYRTNFSQTYILDGDASVEDLVKEYKNLYDVTYNISMIDINNYEYKLNFELK